MIWRDSRNLYYLCSVFERFSSRCISVLLSSGECTDARWAPDRRGERKQELGGESWRYRCNLVFFTILQYRKIRNAQCLYKDHYDLWKFFQLWEKYEFLVSRGVGQSGGCWPLPVKGLINPDKASVSTVVFGWPQTSLTGQKCCSSTKLEAKYICIYIFSIFNIFRMSKMVNYL